MTYLKANDRSFMQSSLNRNHGVGIMRSHGLGISLAATLLYTGLGATPPAASPTIEKAPLWDKPGGSQGMTVSADKVKAGTVTFEVTNISDKEGS